MPEDEFEDIPWRNRMRLVRNLEEEDLKSENVREQDSKKSRTCSMAKTGREREGKGGER